MMGTTIMKELRNLLNIIDRTFLRKSSLKKFEGLKYTTASVFFLVQFHKITSRGNLNRKCARKRFANNLRAIASES